MGASQCADHADFPQLLEDETGLPDIVVGTLPSHLGGTGQSQGAAGSLWWMP